MIENENLTVVSTIITWLAGAIGLGRVYGVLSTKVDKHTEDIAEIKSVHKAEIMDIKKEFTTGDGDQRLMSFSAHDKIQETCQRYTNERINALGVRLDSHDQKLDKILEVVQRK